MDLAGGAVGGGAFRVLSRVFERCLDVGRTEDSYERWKEKRSRGVEGWRLSLQLLKLRLHSTSNAYSDDISLGALDLVK